MLMKTWLLFLAVSILPVLSPGPGMLLAISNALRYGPQATFYSALGNALGLTLMGLPSPSALPPSSPSRRWRSRW
jgi:threonine/homoserine/homoserine lactone efflux protein